MISYETIAPNPREHTSAQESGTYESYSIASTTHSWTYPWSGSVSGGGTTGGTYSATGSSSRQTGYSFDESWVTEEYSTSFYQRSEVETRSTTSKQGWTDQRNTPSRSSWSGSSSVSWVSWYSEQVEMDEDGRTTTSAYGEYLLGTSVMAGSDAPTITTETEWTSSDTTSEATEHWINSYSFASTTGSTRWLAKTATGTVSCTSLATATSTAGQIGNEKTFRYAYYTTGTTHGTIVAAPSSGGGFGASETYPELVYSSTTFVWGQFRVYDTVFLVDKAAEVLAFKSDTWSGAASFGSDEWGVSRVVPWGELNEMTDVSYRPSWIHAEPEMGSTGHTRTLTAFGSSLGEERRPSMTTDATSTCANLYDHDAPGLIVLPVSFETEMEPYAGDYVSSTESTTYTDEDYNDWVVSSSSSGASYTQGTGTILFRSHGASTASAGITVSQTTVVAEIESTVVRTTQAESMINSGTYSTSSSGDGSVTFSVSTSHGTGTTSTYGGTTNTGHTTTYYEFGETADFSRVDRIPSQTRQAGTALYTATCLNLYHPWVCRPMAQITGVALWPESHSAGDVSATESWTMGAPLAWPIWGYNVAGETGFRRWYEDSAGGRWVSATKSVIEMHCPTVMKWAASWSDEGGSTSMTAVARPDPGGDLVSVSVQYQTGSERTSAETFTTNTYSGGQEASTSFVAHALPPGYLVDGSPHKGYHSVAWAGGHGQLIGTCWYNLPPGRWGLTSVWGHGSQTATTTLELSTPMTYSLDSGCGVAIRSLWGPYTRYGGKTQYGWEPEHFVWAARPEDPICPATGDVDVVRA